MTEERPQSQMQEMACQPTEALKGKPWTHYGMNITTQLVTGLVEISVITYTFVSACNSFMMVAMAETILSTV